MLENRMRKFDRETSGREALAEIRLYDESMAEIYAGHMAEKCRKRKHRENRARRTPGNKKIRHACKMWERNHKAFEAGKSNADFMAESREKILIDDFYMENSNMENLPKYIDELVSKAEWWDAESDIEWAHPYGDLAYAKWAWAYCLKLKEEAERLIEELPANDKSGWREYIRNWCL